MNAAPLLAGLVVLGACGPDGKDTAAACPTSPVLLRDANNYGFSGALDLASVDTMAGADLRIDWSAATTDLRGHAMDPAADVDTVTVVAFPSLSEAEVEEALSDNALLQADIGAYAFQTFGEDGATETTLSALTLLGNDIDIETYLTEGSATWMLILATGTTPGVGSRLLQFVRPLDSSANTEVSFTPASTALEVEVNLEDLSPVQVPSGEVVLLDGTGLGVDGRGQPLDLSDIDTVKVGFFAERSFESLADDFLNLEAEADALWSAQGTWQGSFDLSLLAGEVPFSGVSAEGIWILSLQCSDCSNPAPLFFSELVACEEP